jgi:hypothetical protein
LCTPLSDALSRYSEYITGFLIGIASGLAANAFVTWVQRPVIEVSNDNDDLKYPRAYLHVRVKNKKVMIGNRFFQRAMAVDCESQVSFTDKRTGKGVGPFKTKWARQNEGLPNALSRTNLYVGQSDGGDDRGVQLDITLRMKGQNYAWICDPEREAAESRGEDLAKWKLPLGSYIVKVEVQYAQGTSDAAVFDLENNLELDKTKLTLSNQ